MRRQRNTPWQPAGVALALFAAGCGGSGGGGTGSGGSAPVVEVSSPDSRCAPLPGPFPPGLDLIPGFGSRALVANFTPPSLLPFDLGAVPPSITASGSVPALPPDSDGDGCSEPSTGPCAATAPFPGAATSPQPDGVLAVSASLALMTASSYEEVIFVNPADGRLVTGTVSTPASFAARQYFFLPAPGSSASRTAVSTSGCLPLAPGALDSRGDLIVVPPIAGCIPGTPSFRTTFTSGAAISAGRLFVSMSNLGDNSVPANAQYLPGAVLVYDFDLSSGAPVVTPNAVTPVLTTTGFNPTHVTAYRTPSGRDLVLVTVSGAIGRIADDPSTPVLESGGIALSDAAIDVIDAQTLQIVATVPLGRVGLSFDRLAIDPTGRVALTGTAIGRALYGIDLLPLSSLPAAPPAPVVLDGSGGPDARIFYAGFPFTIPALPGGAPAGSCDGYVVSADWNVAGTKLFATEFCDGTLSTVAADLSGSPTLAELRGARFRFQNLAPAFAPVSASSVGKPRAPGSLRVRGGVPGVTYTGPDVFVLVGNPDGLLCGIRVESQ
jgi:hypothetical protein